MTSTPAMAAKGRLQPGAKADIVVIDMGHDRMGHVIDPIQSLMMNSSGRDVRTVIYPGVRHEIHNEPPTRVTVEQDIIEFINGHL